MTKPVIYMIAGPNGAGKTTLAYTLLPKFLAMHEFVNADEIARGLSPFNSQSQSVPAGGLMLARMDDLISKKASFAFETTGAGHIYLDKLIQAKRQGY